MPTQSLLNDFVLVLGAALAVLLVSRRIHLPPTLGFMLTGMVIGPHGLRAISATHEVEALADVGVTLLLFVIGLEFSIGRLREYQRAFLLGGALQVLITVGAVTAILAGILSPGQALVLGCMVALSSTAMVFRLLAERQETASPAGRIMAGILLFQDFAMVPMIALVPALAGGATRLSLGPRVILGTLAAALAFLGARFLMPRALALVAHSGVRELFVIGAVFFCLSSAAVTAHLGLSSALGAFLAGILISESEYSHQVVAEILPFRDLFISLFFVSIGMLVDVGFVAAHAVLVLGASACVILAKALIVAAVVLLLGYPIRIALIAGLGLAQIGEFSFVIARLAKDLDLLTVFQDQLFLAAAVVTLGATPFLMRMAPDAGVWLGKRLARTRVRRARAGRDAHEPGGEAAFAAAEFPDSSGVPAGPGAGAHRQAPRKRLENHVVIVGYGLNGRNLARVLRAVGIPYLAIDLDGRVVRAARRDGEENILYGDATRRDTLEQCSVVTASAVVFAIADPDADRRGVRMVRSLGPRAAIIVRTRLVSQVEELRRLGADEVIPEEFETSIAIFAHVLARLHVPSNVIRNQERVLRSEAYEFLRGKDITPGREMERISALLAAGTTDSFLVEEGSFAQDLTIEQTRLRSRTGATIIAVVRDGRPVVSPPPDFPIERGDVLILVGSHAALEQAFELLATSPGQGERLPSSRSGPEPGPDPP